MYRLVPCTLGKVVAPAGDSRPGSSSSGSSSGFSVSALSSASGSSVGGKGGETSLCCWEKVVVQRQTGDVYDWCEGRKKAWDDDASSEEEGGERTWLGVEIWREEERRERLGR